MSDTKIGMDWEKCNKVIAANHSKYQAEIEAAGVHYIPGMPDETDFLRRVVAQFCKGLNCRALDEVDDHRQFPELEAYLRWRRGNRK